MASKRKRHLQYQAKKGRLQSVDEPAVSVHEVTDSSKDLSESVNAPKSTVKKSTKKPEFVAAMSKLPESETSYVKKELVYLLFIAALLAALYLVIWLVFKYTLIDEKLYSLIKLGK